MASPLTWRNVESPNFAPAMQGQRLAADLLDRALGGARDTIDTWQQGQQAIAETEAAQRAARYTDPTQLRAAIADGSIGAGLGSNLTAAALGRLNNRVSDLLSQAVTGQRLTEDQYTFGRRQGADQAMDVARPGMNAGMIAAAQGRTGDALTSLSNPALLGLPPAEVARLTAGIHQQAGQALGTTRDQLGFIRGEENRDYNQEATRLMANFGQSGSLTPELARQWARNNLGNVPHQVRTAVEAGINAQIPNTFGVNPAVTGSGAANLINNAVNAANGSGTYSDYLVRLESGGNANAKNSKSSATGLHQFTDRTWLSTVRSANPAWASGMSEDQILSQRTNPERSTEMEGVLRASNASALSNANLPSSNSNLYAMHHFGEGSGLKFARASASTPVSQILTKDQIDANPYLKGMTKGELEANWNQRAGVAAPTAPATPTAAPGSPAASLIAQSSGAMNRAAAVENTAVQAAADPTGQVAGIVEARQRAAQGATPESEATRLGERLGGRSIPHDELVTRIREVAASNNISAAEASVVLENSTLNRPGWGQRMANAAGRIIGVEPDWFDTERLRTNGAQAQAVPANASIVNRSEQGQLNQLQAQAAAQLPALQADVTRLRALASEDMRYMGALNQAQARLAEMQAAVGTVNQESTRRSAILNPAPGTGPNLPPPAPEQTQGRTEVVQPLAPPPNSEQVSQAISRAANQPSTVAEVDTQISNLRQQASALPLSSMERSSLLNQIRDLQMLRRRLD